MGVRNRGDLADLFVRRIGERQGSDAHERSVAIVALAGATFAGVQGAGSRTTVIENAVKYTPDNGKITVTDGVTADGVFLTIKDDGIGMDDETGRRMFDRYYRGDKSRQKGGNGLGLATVKKIAEVLGVKISVNTAPDEGTEFTFIF